MIVDFFICPMIYRLALIDGISNMGMLAALLRESEPMIGIIEYRSSVTTVADTIRLTWIEQAMIGCTIKSRSRD